MSGSLGKKLTLVGLAGLLVVTGLAPGSLGIARADTTVESVQSIDTTGWTPLAPGPTGLVYDAANNDLLVVDGDRNAIEPFDGINFWVYDLDTNSVTDTGSLPTPEGTGIAYDPSGNGTLFISDDGPQGVYVIDLQNGVFDDNDPDVFIDLEALSGDTEDPTLAGNGHLYVLNGAEAQIFDIDPVDGDFTNGVSISDFFIPNPTSGTRPAEWEGLAFDAATGHLLAGAQEDENDLIYEIAIPPTPVDGPTFIQIHDANGIAGLDQISGLAVGADDTYWIADRGSLGDAESVDGQIHQVTFGPVAQTAPVAQDQTVSTQPSESIQITLVATDVNGDDLTYSIVTPPVGSLGTLTGNTVTYTPTATPGQDSFTFKANDGVTGDSNIATVTINVESNQPPVITVIDDKTVAEGLELNFTATATDPNEGQTVTFSEVGTWPAGANLSTAGVFSWTPTEAEGPGVYHLTIRATDIGPPTPASSTTIVDITVSEVNRAPVVSSPGDLGPHAETEQVDVTLGGSDPDRPLGSPANTLTWSATGLPAGLGINPATGKITGTVATGATAASPYSVTVTATDHGTPALHDTVAFQWAITNTNLSPILGAIGDQTATQGRQLSFTATATDPDGDGLTFSLINPPSGAAISSGGGFTWTPSQAPGDYPVTVKVTDNGSPVLSDQETFIVTVEAEPSPDPDDPFTDDDGHIFENAIQWLAGEGITQGCNPPANDHFCPDDHVTRGQMAAFLVRAQSLPVYNGPDRFRDDDGSVFEGAIERLAQAGITVGCNPPANDRFCPERNVTRGEMAAFLGRAFGYTDNGGGDWFVDDDGSVFENAIDRLRTAGVTQGCNPPANDRYCPDDFVTRGQMAAFLKRAFGE